MLLVLWNFIWVLGVLFLMLVLAVLDFFLGEVFVLVSWHFFATDRITNEQLTTGITRLTLEASANPELSPKVKNLIDGMLRQPQEVEAEVFWWVVRSKNATCYLLAVGKLWVKSLTWSHQKLANKLANNFKRQYRRKT